MVNRLWFISKTVSDYPGTYRSGQTFFAADEYAALEMFKLEHDLCPNDEFYVVELPSSAIYRFIVARPAETKPVKRE